jgi:hypothetical protein
MLQYLNLARFLIAKRFQFGGKRAIHTQIELIRLRCAKFPAYYLYGGRAWDGNPA